MTTAYTSLLGLALPVTGELSGTWGDTVNNSITSLLDSAIAGTTTLSSDADVTLTTTTGASNTSRQAILLWTAGGTVTRNITAPAQSKIYTVINASSSTQSIVLRGVGPTTGVTIVKGESAVCAWNGSDFIKISNTAGPGTFTNLTVTGNTSLGDADTDTITQAASYVTGTQLKSAKTATNTLSLAAYDVDGTAYTNLITLTAANEPTLALTSTGVGTINNMSIGATTASTGAFTTLSATGVATFSAGTAALPAITTTGDTNTGIFFSAADTINFSTGAIDKARISSGVHGVFTVGTQGSVGGLGTDYGTLGAWGSAGGGLRIYRGTGAGAPIGTIYADGGGLFLSANEAQPMMFSINGSEAMRIAAASGGVNAVGIGYTSLTSVGNNGLAVLGNVGIGTASPSSKLEIIGVNPKLTINANDSVNGRNATLSLIQGQSADPSGTCQIMYGASNSTTAGILTFVEGDGTTERMRLDASGNLGVGDTSPTTRLSIGGISTALLASQTSTYAPSANSAATSFKIFNNSQTTDAYASLEFWVRNVNNNINIAYIASPSISTSDVGTLTFGRRTGSATSAESMRIDSSGNLRVGTTTGPASAKLVVAGGLSVNNNTDDATSVASYGNFFAKTTTVSPSVTTTIKNAIGSEAAMYLVSGSYAGASIRFFDIVVTMGTGLTPVVVSSGGVNSPPARTYSNTSEQLGINFGGANTFVVLVTGMGSNEAS